MSGIRNEVELIIIEKYRDSSNYQLYFNKI